MALIEPGPEEIWELFKHLFEERQGVVSAEYKAMVIRQCESGLAEDVYVNTFTFLADDDKVTAADDINSALIDFYENPGTVGAIDKWYHPCVNNSRIIKIYKLSDLKPREPLIRVSTATTTRITSVGMPEEVAVVLSFSAAAPHTARRRGRIYFGPLVHAAVTPMSGTDISSVHAELQQGLTDGAIRLANHVDAGWLIHSLAGAGSFSAVETGWVDNAFDTQRRRGMTATLRRTWAKA